MKTSNQAYVGHANTDHKTDQSLPCPSVSKTKFVNRKEMT